MLVQALYAENLKNSTLVKDVRKLEIDNANLRKNQHKCRTKAAAPSAELAERCEDIKRVAQKFAIVSTAFVTEQLLKSCDPKNILSIDLEGSKCYSSEHAREQANCLEVSKVLLPDLHDCLGPKGSPWLTKEVCHFCYFWGALNTDRSIIVRQHQQGL